MEYLDSFAGSYAFFGVYDLAGAFLELSEHIKRERRALRKVHPDSDLLNLVYFKDNWLNVRKGFESFVSEHADGSQNSDACRLLASYVELLRDEQKRPRFLRGRLRVD
jgi:hypothetical protein